MWHCGPAENAILNLEEIHAGARCGAPVFVFGGPLPKRGANQRSSRRLRSRVQRQWAAVIQKATPKIVDCLIEAAESLGDCAPTLPATPVNGIVEEAEDESLAALLLRFLRTPETSGINALQPVGNTAVTFESENPLVE